MKKVSLLLALALIAALLAPAALAATSGNCGKYITWKYTAGTGNNGYGATLTLTGFGDMYDYASKGAPWYSNAQKITHIVINSTEYGIRSIGNYAFQSIYTSDISPIPDTVTSPISCASILSRKSAPSTRAQRANGSSRPPTTDRLPATAT